MNTNPEPLPKSANAFVKLLKCAGISLPELEPSDLKVPRTARGYQITDTILVSHWIPAFNPEFISRFGIKSILCLDGKLRSSFASALGVEKIISFNMPDGKGTTPNMIHHLVDTLKELVDHHPSVLVQCNAGQSRSPSIVAAYLTKYKSDSLKDALQLVTQARSPEREVKMWKETRSAIERALGDL